MENYQVQLKRASRASTLCAEGGLVPHTRGLVMTQTHQFHTLDPTRDVRFLSLDPSHLIIS